ncbi:L10-interacting MYB domain-containing protein-like [Phragmites australis]|uniref:L10-interacting MYB domain-containing protein-like n=1 Tax=Phragmites australis TaxID=29695 RepID=UPI002D78DDC3|nr:L10-interacting MYB domain-containing protein-like [Phragmites australis]
MWNNADGSCAKWPNERTWIVCEIFAKQVRIGNRSSTHFNKVGYDNMIAKFKERTDLSYMKLQFKNRWDKLKREYATWKLLLKQTSLGWIKQRDIPRSFRFEHRGLQNEDKLKIMFEDLRNTGADHWDASSGTLPGSPHGPEDEGEGEGDEDTDYEEECGATPGTKGFFVAFEIFIKIPKREMFLTLDTPEERFEWLKMKQAKYYP